MSGVSILSGVLALSLALVPSGGANPARAEAEKRLAAFEARLAAEPEDLRTGAEYRQHAIALKAYDRAIKFLERLARQPSAGPHAYLTLALAYVDKVPDAGMLRQLYLGRDAMNALTKSLGRQRDDVPLYIRGLINLFYDRAFFHRTEKGVADLEEARRLTAAHPTAPWGPRIEVSLGDGYWRLDQRDRARGIWREALSRFPDSAALAERVRADDRQMSAILDRVFDPSTRIDTSLRELFPDVLPFSALGTR